MGYRSDIRMVITGPKELILTQFATLRLAGDDAMVEALDNWEIFSLEQRGDPNGAVAILGRGGVDWKWYPEFSDVRAHTAIFHHFEEMHNNGHDYDDSPEGFEKLSGRFVRIGEDDDDIETVGFGEDDYDLARPVRSIDCDFDHYNGDDLRPRLASTQA